MKPSMAPLCYQGRSHVLRLGLVCSVLEDLAHGSSPVLHPITCWPEQATLRFLGPSPGAPRPQSFPSVKPISQSITVSLSFPTIWSSDTFLAMNTPSNSLAPSTPYPILTEFVTSEGLGLDRWCRIRSNPALAPPSWSW